MIYPLFYILKSQYEVILGLIFWNMANDTFNTRQSKRLFPAITAGGTLGSIWASFLTPLMSKGIGIEGLLWVYLLLMLMSASVSFYMGRRVVLIPYRDQGRGSEGNKGKGIWGELGYLKSLTSKYLVIRLLIILTLIPNMVIPLLNYSFNFAADKQFASESGILAFFSYFKGIMNIITFITLLFVGRLYNRIGLPVSMMIHPINYLLSFLGLFLSMDAVVASYARISTTIIRNTVNNPARAALMGILPGEGRAIVRAFLRGAVVRVGIMSGSGLIYLVNALIGSHQIPMAGAILSGLWTIATLILKVRYAEILSKSILEGSLDPKGMDIEDVENIFRDPAGKERLIKAFLESKGDDRLWHARILKMIGEPRLSDLIIEALPQESPKIRRELIGLLETSKLEQDELLFSLLKEEKDLELLGAIVKRATELSPQKRMAIGKALFENSQDPRRKAYGIWILYPTAPPFYRDLLSSWLSSEDPVLKEAGLKALRGIKEKEFLPYLKSILNEPNSPHTKALAIETLASLGLSETNQILYPFLGAREDVIKKAALNALDLRDPQALNLMIKMLLDKDPEIRRLSFERLRTGEYEDPTPLLQGVRVPSRQAREYIFRVLEEVGIRDNQVYRFVKERLKEAYQSFLDSESIRHLHEELRQAQDETLEKTFLGDKHRIQKALRVLEVLEGHLRELVHGMARDVVRVLASQIRNEEFKRAWKALYSPNNTIRGNALELLDTLIDRRIGQLLMPLLESNDPKHLKRVAKERLKLSHLPNDTLILLRRLLSAEEWVTVVLTMEFAEQTGYLGELRDLLVSLYGSHHPCIRMLAQRALNLEMECEVDATIELSEKILMLRSIYLFGDLTVQELAAIAIASKEVRYPKDTIVFKEGEKGDSLYLVTKGKVAVIKAMGEEGSPEGIKLAEIGPGDYFGEMALIEDTMRSATIKTLEPSIFLVLEKHEFNELVMEYPSIPLEICKALSKRLRELQRMVVGQACET
ncbi:MAG: Npt1/Npt2 family nucleotide transporter [Desulfatiglandales bacterium]